MSNIYDSKDFEVLSREHCMEMQNEIDFLYYEIDRLRKQMEKDQEDYRNKLRQQALDQLSSEGQWIEMTGRLKEEIALLRSKLYGGESR